MRSSGTGSNLFLAQEHLEGTVLTDWAGEVKAAEQVIRRGRGHSLRLSRAG